jgi:hypothetical protein
MPKKDPKERLKDLDSEEREKYYAFRKFLWNAIDNGESVDFAELAEMLGMKGPAYNPKRKNKNE